MRVASRSRLSVRPEAGSLLIPFLFASMLLTAFILVSMEASQRSRRQVEVELTDLTLKNVGESVMSMAANHLWEQFLVAQGTTPPRLPAIKAWLDGRGITRTVDQVLVAGVVTTVTTPPHDLDAMGIPTEMAMPGAATGVARYAGARILDLRVERRDVNEAVVLSFETQLGTSESDGPMRTRRVKKSFALMGKPFEGLGYALLSNNVNCIMCHARFDRTDRYWNRDPARYGTFAGVKVGSLESMMIRTGSADSGIAGTFYARGLIMDKSGNILNGFGGTSMWGYALDGNGNLQQGVSGAMTQTALPLVNETGLGAAASTLPEAFPSVVPDLNANRLVDPDEFQLVSDGASGTLSGGVIVPVAAGSSYSGAGMPATTAAPALQGTHTGNLVLYGTEADPVLIDGKVAVDGDVAIAGVFKGSGEIIATGNVYVVGPVRYADGTTIDPLTGNPERSFGMGADGTVNQLAIGAGGNIMVGDYLRKSGVPVTGTPAAAFNFTLSEVTLFNRMEWTKTQATLPGAGGVMVANPLYQPGYLPRYYTMNPGDPVVLWVGSEVWFDPATSTWQGSEHQDGWDPGTYTTLDPTSPEYIAAVVRPLNPTGDWLSAATLAALWDEQETLYGGQALEIDAMLYTNNSIMALAKKSSGWLGKMVINGGIVAADTGILIPGNTNDPERIGLQLNYDGRLATAFDLRASDSILLIPLLSE